MKVKHAYLAAACGLALQAACLQSASADTVLYDQSGFVTGQQSFSQSFNLDTPGVLTVTLQNVAWPQQLSSLDLLLSSAEGSIAPVMGAGTASFNIGSGTLFAQWFGTAQQGGLNLGVFGLKIEFSPTVVPLPASITLFLSGLALLAWQRRTRVANPMSLSAS